MHGEPEKNLGPSVVKRLCKGLHGQGYDVYYDNYLSSVELLDHLQGKGVNACGTIVQNRRFLPKKFKPDDTMERGDHQWRSHPMGLVCVKRMDSKGVMFVSNHHDPTDIDKTKGKLKDGTRIQT